METFNLDTLCEEEKRIELVNDFEKSELANLSKLSIGNERTYLKWETRQLLP